MARLAEEGVRSIGFARSRRAAELLAGSRARSGRRAAFAREGLPGRLPGRGPAELERQLASDELIAVASTNALELGIDIGSLDAAAGRLPGTRASMWQQAGAPAGVRSNGGAVAQDEPLDQYLVTHPADLFDKPPEAAIDPTNPATSWAPAVRRAEQPLSDEEVSTYWPEASEPS